MELHKDKIADLKRYFQARSDVAFSFLFGSYASKTATKHSDVDIAVYFYPRERYPVPYEEELYYDGEEKIWEDLDKLLGKEVELLVLNRAPAVVCAAALRGVRLAIKDWRLYFDFMEVISREGEDFAYSRTKDFLERCRI